MYPNLYAYVINKNMSVKSGLAVSDLLEIFRLQMSRMAYNEFLVFKEELESLKADNDQTDVWICNWNGGLYSSRQFLQTSLCADHTASSFLLDLESKVHAENKFFCLAVVGR